MTAGPPPWRVFDAPDPGNADAEAPVHGAGAQSTTGTSTRSLAVRPEVVVGLVAAVGGLALAWLLATGGPTGSLSVGGGISLSGSPDPSGIATGGEVVVDVVGAVLRPGVYHLPAGSRVGDAISAAGGFGPRVAAARVDAELNLAAIVHDGERVVVPSRDDAAAPGRSPGPTNGGGASGPGSAGGKTIDLNTATEAELDTLPGIGPVTAAKIVASRAGQPFRAVEDLLERKLVGQKTFDSIKALVTVG